MKVDGRREGFAGGTFGDMRMGSMLETNWGVYGKLNEMCNGQCTGQRASLHKHKSGWGGGGRRGDSWSKPRTK